MASLNKVLESAGKRHTREEHEEAIKSTLEYALSKDQDSFLAVAVMLCQLEGKPEAKRGGSASRSVYGGLSYNRAY